MGRKSGSISASTVVLGSFARTKIKFFVGDVKLENVSQKLKPGENEERQKKFVRQQAMAFNIQKVDKRDPGVIPKKIPLCAGQLSDLSISKEKICQHLRNPDTLSVLSNSGANQKKRKQKTIKMDPRRNC